MLDPNTEEVFQVTDILTGVSGITLFSSAISISENGKKLYYSHYTDNSYSIYNYTPDLNDMVKVDPAEIDVVVMHAPGTIKGDLGEVNAIKAVFGENLPAMTSNQWKIGHTFATSGILNLELALLMLKHQEFISVPFSDISKKPRRLLNILVNAVGFGGNAVSILVRKP